MGVGTEPPIINTMTHQGSGVERSLECHAEHHLGGAMANVDQTKLLPRSLLPAIFLAYIDCVQGGTGMHV